MAALSATDLGTILDGICLGYAKLVGTSGSGYGLGEPDGTYGTADAAGDLVTAVAGMSDVNTQVDLLAATSAWKDSLSSIAYYAAKVRPLLGTLGKHALSRGSYASVDAMLTFLNTGDTSKWQALAPKQWRDIHYAALGSYPSAYNVYFEVLQGSTYANGLRKLVVSGAVQTAGTSIDSTKYAGGVAKLIASGVTGSGLVTVTGTAFDPATKTTSSGVTWTVTVTGNGTFTLAVGTAPANSLIVAVSSISAAAGLTAGTIYAEAHRPSGRVDIV